MDLLSNGLDISNSKKWVGHKLEPDHLSVWLDGSDNVIRVSNINHGEFNSVLGGDFVEISVGSSVEIVSGNSVVAILNDGVNIRLDKI